MSRAGRGRGKTPLYEKKITTKFDISPAIAVYADESYLRRILLNLLDNAIKYNVDGGTVSISLGKSDLLAIFRIANTGPEIPPYMKIVSSNDFIGPTRAARPKTVGSGLGLSICRELVLAHGGDIWLDRVQPGWTAFALTLPGPKSQ